MKNEVIDGTSWGLPLPVPDEHSERWFAECANGVLTVQYCEHCQRAQHYPRAWCTSCGGETGWRDCEGQGTVYSFTVIRQMRAKPFADMTPYVVALIDVAVRVRMLGILLDADPDDVAIGARVQVQFVSVADGIVIPMWTLSDGDPRS